MSASLGEENRMLPRGPDGPHYGHVVRLGSTLLPFGPGVSDPKAVALGVALRSAAGHGAHGGEVAAVLGGMVQARVEQRELGALFARARNRAGTGEVRDAAVQVYCLDDDGNT